jgi:hypothetical protein
MKKSRMLAAVLAICAATQVYAAGGPSSCVASSSPETLAKLRKEMDVKKIEHRSPRNNLVCVAQQHAAVLQAALKKVAPPTKDGAKNK